VTLGILIASAALALTPQHGELTVRIVGNAGVLLSDSATSILVDLPYESGAFGYDRYDPAQLRPPGAVVAAITHHHRDHFDRGLFQSRPGWRVIGPRSAVGALPPARVLGGDSVQVGSFAIVAVATPHTQDHRSYRIRWRGRVLDFVGDTEEPSFVLAEPALDLLLITPWLACSARDAGRTPRADRVILYHRQAGETDRGCGIGEALHQGSTIALTPADRSPR
jgi:glyoxylase-like metal-dependent hydrolase (beta-lactamase superfamily II)